jgi:hypothetical protein
MGIGSEHVQAAVRGERANQGVPVELDVGGDDQKIEFTGQIGHGSRVATRDDMLRAEAAGFVELRGARGESRHIAAVGSTVRTKFVKTFSD